MYLMTCTRPDLAYPLSLLARYVAPVHRAWGSCLEDGLELSSLVMLTPPGSSCEAEIYAGAMAAQELRWLTYLLTDLGKAPRSPPVLYWYLKLRAVLGEIVFTPLTANHSLFMLDEGEQRSFIVVYVDDILIFSPSSDLVKEVMLKLQDKFKCKALGEVSFYLGLQIERAVEKRCMRGHQRKYLEALAANLRQSEGHVATPFPSGFKCVKGPEEESVGEEERRRFHSLVGSLMYAAVNTQPDVAFATGQLARVVQ
ncbi:unnamed protein product [Closterium sp. NIES-53]